MYTIHKEDLLLTFKNYQRPFKTLCRRKATINLGDDFLKQLSIFEEELTSLSSTVSKEIYDILQSKLEHLDAIYDTLDCMPEVYNVEPTFRIPAMLLMTSVLRRGITELDRTNLSMEVTMFNKLPFDWSL